MQRHLFVHLSHHLNARGHLSAVTEGQPGAGFDLSDSLSASMGVALIIPLLNSCFLAQPGSFCWH